MKKGGLLKVKERVVLMKELVDNMEGGVIGGVEGVGVEGVVVGDKMGEGVDEGIRMLEGLWCVNEGVEFRVRERRREDGIGVEVKKEKLRMEESVRNGGMVDEVFEEE